MWRARRTKRSMKTASLPKAAAGLAPRLLQAAREIGGAIHHAHAAAAAAERRLDDQREADFRRDLFGLFERRVIAVSVPGTTGMPAFCARRRAAVLSPSRSSSSALGPDEGDAGALAGARQRRILGEEAVARMDRVHVLLAGQGNDALHVQVGFHRAFAFADQVGFVGLEAVQGQAVFLGIDGHGAQAQFIGRAQDANRDFAAIQSKQFFHFAEENGQDVQPFFLE